MLPVDLICAAIATQEGWFSEDPNVTPRARNNPGDLRFAGQLGATAPEGPSEPAPIAHFETPQAGIVALYRQIWLYVAMKRTLRQIIEAWAPPSQNDTSAYLANVLQWTGLPADTPVIELLPPLVPMNVKIQS